ncbi:hypothetical protein AB0D46_33895 [Streptomyces sp. NPDC048383]|uniref:hypothetical protein n=1 Tax=Streptomyces sp. NPDC048383 TaxID=3155386 RepID=UPI00342A9CCA
MDDQRGRAPGRGDRRRFLALTGGAALLFTAAGAAALWPGPQQDPHPGSESGSEPDRQRVRTDPAPLNSRFEPALGPLADPHWLGYDIDASSADRFLPGPDSRIRLVGIARMRPGAAARIVEGSGHAFGPAELPDPPARLRAHVPAGARWQGSPGFDAAANRPGPSVAPSGTYRLDAGRDLVWFDVVLLHT